MAVQTGIFRAAVAVAALMIMSIGTTRDAKALVQPLGTGQAAVQALAPAGFSEFRDVARLDWAERRLSANLWAEKLMAIGAIPPYGPKSRDLEHNLRAYGGGGGKLAGLFTGLGSLNPASNIRYLVPLCDTWACGDLVKAIPGVAVPLTTFALFAVFTVGRIRRKRGTLERGSAVAAS